jgi:hypothetical protein
MSRPKSYVKRRLEEALERVRLQKNGGDHRDFMSWWGEIESHIEEALEKLERNVE